MLGQAIADGLFASNDCTCFSATAVAIASPIKLRLHGIRPGKLRFRDGAGVLVAYSSTAFTVR